MCRGLLEIVAIVVYRPDHDDGNSEDEETAVAASLYEIGTPPRDCLSPVGFSSVWYSSLVDNRTCSVMVAYVRRDKYQQRPPLLRAASGRATVLECRPRSLDKIDWVQPSEEAGQVCPAAWYATPAG